MVHESVKQVIKEIQKPKPKARLDLLCEASLRRILRHISGKSPETQGPSDSFDSTGHYAILTSWRFFTDTKRDKELQQKESEKEANKLNFSRLGSALAKHNLGFIRLTGAWLDTDSDYRTKAYERSVFVPSQSRVGAEKSPLTLKFVKSLGKKYNQDAIIYAGPENDYKVILYEYKRKTGIWEIGEVWGKANLSSAQDISNGLVSLRAELKDRADRKADGEELEDLEWHSAGGSQVGGSGTKLRYKKGDGEDKNYRNKTFDFSDKAKLKNENYGIKVIAPNQEESKRYNYDRVLQQGALIREDTTASIEQYAKDGFEVNVESYDRFNEAL